MYIKIVILVNLIHGKKETHTQTEILKKQQCVYMKSKKNLLPHMKQVTIYIVDINHSVNYYVVNTL